MDAREMQVKSTAVKRAKAEKRRSKVAELKSQGMSGTQIATELGEKTRTIYHDFSVLKREGTAD